MWSLANFAVSANGKAILLVLLAIMAVIANGLK